MNRFFSFIYMTIFLSVFVQAREYRHFTISDGLSSMDVTAICENENYLWIATNDGLNCFDGKNFKVYKRNYESKNSMSENNIETLMFDSKGLLWIGFKTGGVDIYNPRNSTFTHISRFIEKYPQRVISMYEDSQHNIWLGTWGEGIYKLTPNGDSYAVERHYSEYIISSIIEKPKGKLWVGSYYGNLLYDINTKSWQAFTSMNNAVTQFLDTKEVNSLYFSGWEKGLFKLSWDDSITDIEEQYIPNSSGDIYRIFPATDNQIYLGTWGNGLKILNLDSKNLQTRVANLDNIEASVVLSFYRDRYKKLWIGTYGSGLLCIDENERGIDILEPINRNGFSAAYALKYLGNNKILIGTQGDGLYLYDNQTAKLEAKYLNTHSTMLDKYILSFYYDEKLLIVGSDDSGIHYTPLNRSNIGSFSLKSFYAKDLTKVTSIYKDQRGRYWMGTKQNGLISLKYDESTQSFTDYNHYNTIMSSEITGFSEGMDGELWIFSHDGIYIYDSQSNKISKQGNPSINEIIYSIADDKINQCFWLGTSVGLRKLSYTSNMGIEKIFSSEELPVGAVKDVILDSNNNLWFSIADRIFCYQENIKRLQEIDVEAWGQVPIYSSTKATIEGKDYIIFGGNDKLFKIDPIATLNQPNKNKILLTGLQIDFKKINVGEEVYGIKVLNEEVEYVKAISLSYKSKWISLQFTEIGWNNFKNKYLYKIKGFSEEWQYLDISKPITFSQLSPGEYTLKIAQEGVNKEIKELWSLNISITPPWWQTNWFYFALVLFFITFLLCALFLLRGYYRKRQMVRVKEIEKKKKEEILHEKELFFTRLSHDLLTPFSLIVAPANDLLRDKGMTDDQIEKVEIITKNASFLSNIFNTILDFKKAELYDNEIKEQVIEMVSFVKMAVNIFEYLAKSKDINLSFSSNQKEFFVKSDIVKIERILYNVINNALKYTNEGDSVDVVLRYDGGNTFSIDINDTGIGIAPQNADKIFAKFYQVRKNENSTGLGLGLYITHKFVSALGGKISITSELNIGTKIKIELPANREQLEIENEIKVESSENMYSILLVEDHDQLRNYLEKKLTNHFDVAVASNGLEALDFIKNNLPEIVISDVMMPEMDGIELCTTIKNTPMFSDIFVILLSAKASTEDELKGYQAGADFYIKKPFDPDALIKQIINIYTTRQQRRKQIIGELLIPESEKEFDPKDEFLSNAIKVVEKHLMNENFKIDEFASEMNLSKSVLHRKFKMLLGETPIIFIRNIRLRKAVNLLIESDMSISEIAYTTGFNQSHYFIKCFKEVYKDTPKNYRDKNKHKTQ